MRKNNFGVFTWGVWLLILFIVGCGGYGSSMTNNPPPPPGISNMADHFQFQLTSGRYSTTQTLDYVWSNSGTSAKVTVASTISAGAADLQVFDSMDKLVIDQPLTLNGTFVTAVGVTGDWKIHVVLTGVTGTVSFNVDKM
jgi:hypothetical protein